MHSTVKEGDLKAAFYDFHYCVAFCKRKKKTVSTEEWKIKTMIYLHNGILLKLLRKKMKTRGFTSK